MRLVQCWLLRVRDVPGVSAGPRFHCVEFEAGDFGRLRDTVLESEDFHVLDEPGAIATC